MLRDELQRRLLELPEAERRRSVTWFYEHEHELLGLAEEVDWQDTLSAEQIAELQRRMKEVEEHPERLVPWDVAMERVRLRLEQRSQVPEAK